MPIKKNRIFYVCSYGGSGSKMLCNYLNNFGKSYHIHSKLPPQQLTHIGINTYHEWFSEKKIPLPQVDNYTVIFIYKNPADAILSRFWLPDHLKHIQSNKNITINSVITQECDLYGVENFYNNYTSPNKERNYKIYCIKYEDFFDHISEFNKKLDLPDNPNLYPIKKESIYKRGTKIKKNKDHHDKLLSIYHPLINKMNKMPFIKIV
tara:strand:- start:271 stop:891 length:621 start_codon:yes stop_codon:yes gene_type:complete